MRGEVLVVSNSNLFLDAGFRITCVHRCLEILIGGEAEWSGIVQSRCLCGLHTVREVVLWCGVVCTKLTSVVQRRCR